MLGSQQLKSVALELLQHKHQVSVMRRLWNKAKVGKLHSSGALARLLPSSKGLAELPPFSTRDLNASEQTPTTTILGTMMIFADGTTFKGAENVRIIAGGLVKMQEVAVIQAKHWHMGRLGGAAVWLAAQKFTPTRVTSHLFHTRDVHTVDRIHVSCHRTRRKTLVSMTTSGVGMTSKAVGPAMTTVAGLGILDLVEILLSTV